MKPKASKREEIVKAAVEINEIKKRKTIEDINETKNCPFVIYPCNFFKVGSNVSFSIPDFLTVFLKD